jgi:hypothetical protein
MDHGFAHIRGIDGRTTLAREMKEHDDIDVRSGQVYIDGLSRYLTAQRVGYQHFLGVLEENDVDTQDARVYGRLD